MSKIKVALVLGGYSNEYSTSIKASKLAFQEIDSSKYEVFQVVISKDQWYMVGEENQKIPVDRNSFTVQVKGQTKKFDVCFNLIHGDPGQNGEIQKLWDRIGLRYTGCNAKLSALTFNKRENAEYLAKFGVPSAKRLSFKKGDNIDTNYIVKKMGLPVIVKPNASGSSLGVSKVNVIEQFEQALEFAFAEGDEILIEQFLQGVQVTVAINRHEGKPKIYGITQIFCHSNFFDKGVKPMGPVDYILPARLDQETTKNVEQMAILAYESLKMTTISRSEFIIVHGIPHLLEVNTNPGMSPISPLLDQIKFAGISFREYFSNELEKGLLRINNPLPHEE